ncbi:hypothetical protein ABIC09_001120 [Bradyrhizobium sp. S3.12.5]
MRAFPSRTGPARDLLDLPTTPNVELSYVILPD